jgi:hypothetical protein
VHYKGWDRKYDEVLSLSSQRIAKCGFYTEREDIPYYQKTDNKLKKPVLNLPSKSDKIEIIQDLTKDCLKYSEEDAQEKGNESSEELLNDEDVYEYLIDKVSTRTGNYNRDLRSLNTQTSFVHIPPTGRGDVRIRVNTSNFNRMLNRLNF